MRMFSAAVQIAALVFTVSPSLGADADHIGIIKTMAGQVVVDRDGRAVDAQPNFRLYQGDVIRTGSNGKAGLILEDDTVISMGNGSTLALRDFAFKPNDRKLSFVARVYQGTVSFISGQIAKLAPSLVHIETPNATVGVRGTHLLVRVD